jgi:hypothetical protein
MYSFAVQSNTPAIAAALTDHSWSIRELLWYKVAPTSWVEAAPAKPKRPRGRPPKGVLAEVLASARRLGTFTS